MLANLFKPKWSHPDPEVRARAAVKLDPSQPRQHLTLKDLALLDTSPDVRRVAIAKITDPEILMQILDQEPDTALKERSGERFCELLLGAGNPTALGLEWIKRISSEQTLKLIILKSQISELNEVALRKISDQQILAEIALNAPLTSIRQLAAEQIEAEQVLEELYRNSRGRDKAVHRIARDKLQLLQDSKQRTEAAIKQQTQLLHNLNSLVESDDRLHFAIRLQAISQEWDKLPLHPDTELTVRFTQTLQAGQSISDELNAQQEKLKLEAQAKLALQQLRQQLSSQLKVLRERLVQDCHCAEQLTELLRELTHLTQSISEIPEDEALKTAVQEIHQTAQAALDAWAVIASDSDMNTQSTDSQPLASESNDIEQQLHALNAHVTRINWPQALPEPDALQQIKQQIQSLRAEQRSLKQQQGGHVSQINELLSQLETALGRGEARQAQKLEQDVDKLVAQSSQRLPEAVDSRLKHIKSQVLELKDWQGFAANSKKEQLCVQMEALANSDLDPAQLAEQIRDLQKAWKELDATDPIHSRSLWQRFREASVAAYEPCDAYFKAQSDLRAWNLAQREQICEHLETYLSQIDWEQADWRALEQIINRAKGEWRRFVPVDRGPGKVAQKQFNQLINQADAQLKSHKEACKVMKQALLDEAESLRDEADIRHATEQIRQIQQRWKETGVTFRSQERILWQQLREHSDYIFARLKQEQSSNQQGKRGQRQADMLLEQLHSCLHDPRSVAHSLICLKNIQAEIDALELPARQLEEIQQRHERLKLAIEKEIALATELLNKDQLATLQRLSLLCEKAEQSLAESDEPEQDHLQQLLLATEETPQLKAPYSLLIQKRISTIQSVLNQNSDIEEQLDSAYESARLLCVRLEILLGHPSPEEDQAIRMEYQMQRLQQAIAQQSDSTRLKDIRNLELEWLTVPFAWQMDDLNERFNDLLQAE
ncbi:DUF349 domain-containing protein [Nitrincola sp. MINF-07-Sa-05]|uniref:DUF349 domain-containing protein n=1 Tax=Nitrincola salilacus TaxID=3400273 RepID=UPI003917DC3B